MRFRDFTGKLIHNFLINKKKHINLIYYNYFFQKNNVKRAGTGFFGCRLVVDLLFANKVVVK